MTRILQEQVDAHEWLRRYDRRQLVIRWASRLFRGAILFGIGAGTVFLLLRWT